MLWNQMYGFLKSYFVFPGLTWDLTLVAVGLSIAFGAVWLLGYWPSLFKKVWFWPVMIVSAFLTLLAITFIQIPLQYYINEAFINGFSQKTVTDWLLLTSIPSVIVSGLVQEAAKSVPIAIWRWRSGKTFTPRMGLVIGAVAGAGFGILESVWAQGQVFAAGWTTHYITQYGFDGIAPFWERFFAIGLHVAVSALVGYGIAKGKWWQYLLIASGIHALTNYASPFFSYFAIVRHSQVITNVHIESYIAAIAVLATVWAVILRWRRNDAEITL